jgi:hypothetical protein
MNITAVPQPLPSGVATLAVTGQRTTGPTFGDQLAPDRPTAVVFLRHHG